MASRLLSFLQTNCNLIRTLFTSSSLNPALITALRSLDIQKFTWIQEAVLPHILNRENVVFADQTGSGKTIAYLLPLFNIVKTLEESSGYFAAPGYPRAVVLAPSRELALQIGSVAKTFSHHIKLSTRCIVGGKAIFQQKKALKDPVDVIIATPGRLCQLLDQGHCHFRDVKTVVFDEADTLFDSKAGFIDEIHSGILKRLPKSAQTQFIFASATLTKQCIGRLKSKFSILNVITSNQLHKLPSKLQVNFIDVGGKDKLLELVSLIKDVQSSYKRIVVFCNTIESCRAVEHGLREAGIHEVTSLHGGILPKTRAINYEAFISAVKTVLIATDISCRGIDLPPSTSIVIFDFPSDLREFLHRAGRTARIGNTGIVHVLMTKRDHYLGNQVKSAIKTGFELDLPEKNNIKLRDLAKRSSAVSSKNAPISRPRQSFYKKIASI